MMPSMRRHLALAAASLRYPVMSPLHNSRHDPLAILRIGPGAGRSLIVEVVSDLTASEDLGGHHLRMEVTLLITQEK